MGYNPLALSRKVTKQSPQFFAGNCCNDISILTLALIIDTLFIRPETEEIL